MLSFPLRDVLDEIWDLIEPVSEGIPTYSCKEGDNADSSSVRAGRRFPTSAGLSYHDRLIVRS